jgi:hypothetical protein
MMLAAAAAFEPAAAADIIKPSERSAEPQRIPVAVLAAAPTVDGDPAEWAADGWQRITVRPAVQDDNDNRLGTIDVELQVGVHEGRFYLAARWPDAREDARYKPWEWRGNRYRRGKRLDDMFAARFDLGGDYHSCMIAGVEYKVDVWLWSAGRSNPSGVADDMWQLITTKYTENAAEYSGPDGKTVYIRKRRDDGTPGYEVNKPDRKTFQGDKLPGIHWDVKAEGSVADVSAKANWSDGTWRLEMSRVLDTGHDDDAVLPAGEVRVGAIAVFDRNAGEDKSVSGDLHFDFGALR